MRIVKEYDERKREIIETAQELFIRKGYSQTSVHDIMAAVGIAKSNFYYYFETKEDLLAALVDYYTQQHVEEWQEIIADSRMNALEKLNAVFDISGKLKKSRKDITMALLNAAYNDENIMVRHFLNRKTIDLAGRELGKIIEQGVKEGIFTTPYPKEAIKAVFRICENAVGIVKDYMIEKNPENIDKVMEYFQMIEYFTEKLLGAEAGTIRFADRETVLEMLS